MRTNYICPWIFLLAAAAVNAAPAVAAATAPLQVKAAAHEEAAYVLGPEDQLSIHVADLDDITDKPVRVDPNGFIDLPLIGRTRTAGLTADQLRDVLAGRLAKYIDTPQITINVIEYRSQPVSIIGAVNNPGVHQLQGPKRLIDMISVAGGLRPDAGNKLTLTRQMRWGVLPIAGAHADSSGEFSIAEISVDVLTKGQNPAENIPVRANDVISVPRADLVYVVGEVKRAGGYSLNSRDGISLIRALSLAEGLAPGAAPKKARILRAATGTGSKNLGDVPLDGTPIDLSRILAGKAPDAQLHADDVLFIPNNVSGSALKRAMEAAIQIGTGVLIFH
jgi:polysaccharide export outer membrane protein